MTASMGHMIQFSRATCRWSVLGGVVIGLALSQRLRGLALVRTISLCRRPVTLSVQPASECVTGVARQGTAARGGPSVVSEAPPWPVLTAARATLGERARCRRDPRPAATGDGRGG